MEKRHQASGWRFWGAWALAFLGFPVGGWLANALAGPVLTPLDGVLAGMVTGAVLGLAQWLVLRHRLSLSPWWIGSTAAGMGGGLALGIALLGSETDGAVLALRGLVTGAGVGIAQFMLLRGRTDRAAIWVPVVASGWALGWVITREIIGIGLAQDWPVFGASGALVFQVLTGIALAWIVQSRVPSTVVVGATG